MESVVASIFCGQFHMAPADAAHEGPRLADERGLIHLFDDAEDDAPRIEWLVCLGGGESRATRADRALDLNIQAEFGRDDDGDDDFDPNARFEVMLPLAVA